MTDAVRTPTPIDAIAEQWVDTVAELSPGLATYIGRFEHNDRLDDLSPEGTARAYEATKAALASLEAAEPVDGATSSRRPTSRASCASACSSTRRARTCAT